jgi:hypothetical protein
VAMCQKIVWAQTHGVACGVSAVCLYKQDRLSEWEYRCEEHAPATDESRSTPLVAIPGLERPTTTSES